MALQEENIREVTPLKNVRKRKAQTRSALTIKMPPEALERIEKAVADVQAMAKTRTPDKADVVVWMLTAVRPEDLRQKMEAWNAVFA